MVLVFGTITVSLLISFAIAALTVAVSKRSAV
jgi:hypothetical protein